MKSPLVLCVAALLAAAPAHADHALMQKYRCNTCHAVDKPRVGPAYREVAARYAGQPDAAVLLAARIRDGSAGRWGEAEMPPQDKVSDEAARTLAEWVLTLDGDNGAVTTSTR